MMTDLCSVTTPRPTGSANTGARDFTIRCFIRWKWNTCTHAELQRNRPGFSFFFHRGSIKALSSALIDGRLQGLETQETKQNAAGLIFQPFVFSFFEGFGGFWGVGRKSLRCFPSFRKDLQKDKPCVCLCSGTFRQFCCLQKEVEHTWCVKIHRTFSQQERKPQQWQKYSFGSSLFYASMPLLFNNRSSVPRR